jgi:hypothetical protein
MTHCQNISIMPLNNLFYVLRSHGSPVRCYGEWFENHMTPRANLTSLWGKLLCRNLSTRKLFTRHHDGILVRSRQAEYFAILGMWVSNSDIFAVDITNLSAPQLSQLKKQLDTELEHLTNSFQQLRAAQSKFRDCLKSIASVSAQKETRE